MVLSSLSGAEEKGNNGISIAVVGPPATLDAVSLLVAEWEGTFDLVDRVDLNLVANENLVSLKSPAIAKADLFVLVEEPSGLSEFGILVARLVETRTGMVLGEEFFDIEKVPEVARSLAEKARNFDGEKSPLLGDRVALSILGFGTEALPGESVDAQRAAAGFATLLGARLSAEPGIAVLERRGLGELSFDQGLVEIEKVSFATGDFILDGSVDDREGRSKVRVRLNRPESVDGRWVSSRFSTVREQEIEIEGRALGRTGIEKVAAAVVEMIAEATNREPTQAPAEAWRPEAEVVNLHNEAIRLHRLGAYEEARARLSTALALTDGDFFPARALEFRVRLSQALPHLEPIEGRIASVREDSREFRNFLGEVVDGASYGDLGKLLGPEGWSKTPQPQSVWHLAELARELRAFLESSVPVKAAGEEGEMRKRGAEQILGDFLPGYESVIEYLLDWIGMEGDGDRALKFEIQELKAELAALGRVCSERKMELPGRLADWQQAVPVPGGSEEGPESETGPRVPTLDGSGWVTIASWPGEGDLIGPGLPLPLGVSAPINHGRRQGNREPEERDFQHLSQTFASVRVGMAFGAWLTEDIVHSPAEVRKSEELSRALEEHFFGEHEAFPNPGIEACYQMDRAFFRAFSAKDSERDDRVSDFREVLFEHGRTLAEMRLLGTYLSLEHRLFTSQFSYQTDEFQNPYCFPDGEKRKAFFDLLRLASEIDSPLISTDVVNSVALSLAGAPAEIGMEERDLITEILRDLRDRLPEFSPMRGWIRNSLEHLGAPGSERDPREAIVSLKGYADFSEPGRTIVAGSEAWFLRLNGGGVEILPLFLRRGGILQSLPGPAAGSGRGIAGLERRERRGNRPLREGGGSILDRLSLLCRRLEKWRNGMESAQDRSPETPEWGNDRGR
ncbi:MAG: hypothetical protein KDN19_00505 [Verrucomicrobiae bacterium]|nr:hypothetical protein [Verrucomicrobiae bacterium]